MQRRSFLRFLLSTNAIQVHLLCVGLIVLLSISILTGEAKPDYKWGLLFSIVVYPVLLGLLWLADRFEGQAAVEHVVEHLTVPEQLRRKRKYWRLATLTILIGVSIWLVYSGKQGLQVAFFPAQYLGYLLLAFAALGLGGVNIWHGGPLDLRDDPPFEELESSDLSDSLED